MFTITEVSVYVHNYWGVCLCAQLLRCLFMCSITEVSVYVHNYLGVWLYGVICTEHFDPTEKKTSVNI